MRIKALLLALTTTVALTVATSAMARPLAYEVIPTSPTSLVANVTLVKGEKAAVLVDVPFSRADAYRVAAAVFDSGLHLETIVITHDHPDHFFGLDVLADAFPDARIVANPVVAKDMARSIPIKFKRWSGQLGTNAPRRPVQPVAMAGDTVTLEGHDLKVIGPMQGDHIDSTVVWDPDSRTLIGGDVLYNGVHVWLGEHTPERYAAWLATLDRLDALHPATVIAGHRHPGAPDDNGAIDWTRRYIKAFVAARAASHSSAELSAAMMKAYPDATEVFGGFLLGTSSKVGAGEIPPWDE